MKYGPAAVSGKVGTATPVRGEVGSDVLDKSLQEVLGNNANKDRKMRLKLTRNVDSVWVPRDREVLGGAMGMGMTS
jgi:hypothetical protein